MPFDPSVIGSIGEQPDIGAAIGKGFQLKDLIDQNTLNQLKVKQAKSADADSELLSGLSKKYPKMMSNPQDATQAAEEAAKAGKPQMAAGIMKQSQDAEMGRVQMQVAQLQLHREVTSQVDQQVQNVVSSVDAQTTGPDGKPDSKYDSKTKDALTVGAIKKQRADLEADETMDPQVKKLALSEIDKFLASGQPITYDSIQKASRATAAGVAAYDKKLAQMNVKSEISSREGTLQERTRHDVATEKAAETKAQSGAYDDRERDLLAALAERSVNLPAGLRSQAQIKATIQGLLAKNPDKSPEQIADDIKSGKLKLAAETRGAQTAGTQIGKVALASNELDTFGDQTLQASAAVPRGKFVPWNRLRQTAEASISDPSLLRFKSKMQALENAYNQLASRSGTDMDKRAHIHQLFDAANSPEAVQTLVKSLKEEAVGARDAANKTIAETSGSAIPGAGGPAETPSTGGWSIKPVP